MGGLLAFDPGSRGAFFVQAHPDAFFPIALLAELPFDFHLTQLFAVEIGELEVFEHQFDQLIETDFGFVVVDAGLVAGLLTLGAFFALTDGLAGLHVAVAALSHPGRIFAVDKTVLFDAPNRHFNDPIAVLADDRFFGDDVGDVVADRFADFLPMAQAVAGAAVAALAGGRMVGAKDRFHASSRRLVATTRSLSQCLIFPQIVRRIFENHIHATVTVPVVEEVLHHRVVLLRLLFVAHSRLGNHSAEIPDRRDQLFLDGLLQRLVAPVVDLLAPAVGRPQIGDDFLAETVGGRADDGDLLFDGFHEAFVRRQLFFGVAVFDLALVDVGFGVIEVVLEQRLRPAPGRNRRTPG